MYITKESLLFLQIFVLKSLFKNQSVAHQIHLPYFDAGVIVDDPGKHAPPTAPSGVEHRPELGPGVGGLGEVGISEVRQNFD